MDDKLFMLYYRRGVKGATTGFIMAPNQKIAEILGERYCGQEIGRKFIRVEPAILATTEDLPDELLAELTKPPKIATPTPDDSPAKAKPKVA